MDTEVVEFSMNWASPVYADTRGHGKTGLCRKLNMFEPAKAVATGPLANTILVALNTKAHVPY